MIQRQDREAGKWTLRGAPQTYVAPTSCPRCKGAVFTASRDFPFCLACGWEDYEMPYLLPNGYVVVSQELLSLPERIVAVATESVGEDYY